jgi:hypothetical protein
MSNETGWSKEDREAYLDSVADLLGDEEFEQWLDSLSAQELEELCPLDQPDGTTKLAGVYRMSECFECGLPFFAGGDGQEHAEQTGHAVLDLIAEPENFTETGEWNAT